MKNVKDDDVLIIKRRSGKNGCQVLRCDGANDESKKNAGRKPALQNKPSALAEKRAHNLVNGSWHNCHNDKRKTRTHRTNGEVRGTRARPNGGSVPCGTRVAVPQWTDAEQMLCDAS